MLNIITLNLRDQWGLCFYREEINFSKSVFHILGVSHTVRFRLIYDSYLPELYKC